MSFLFTEFKLPELDRLLHRSFNLYHEITTYGNRNLRWVYFGRHVFAFSSLYRKCFYVRNVVHEEKGNFRNSQIFKHDFRNQWFPSKDLNLNILHPKIIFIDYILPIFPTIIWSVSHISFNVISTFEEALPVIWTQFS